MERSKKDPATRLVRPESVVARLSTGWYCPGTVRYDATQLCRMLSLGVLNKQEVVVAHGMEFGG